MSGAGFRRFSAGPARLRVGRDNPCEEGSGGHPRHRCCDSRGVPALSICGDGEKAASPKAGGCSVRGSAEGAEGRGGAGTGVPRGSGDAGCITGPRSRGRYFRLGTSKNDRS